MRSVSFPARIAFELFGPRTNRIASAMLLLPEPFGPVIAVYPWRKGTVIFRPNDLKFSIWISFRNTVLTCVGEGQPWGNLLLPIPSISLWCPTRVRRDAQSGDGYKSVAGHVYRIDKGRPVSNSPSLGCFAGSHVATDANGGGLGADENVGVEMFEEPESRKCLSQRGFRSPRRNVRRNPKRPGRPVWSHVGLHQPELSTAPRSPRC